MGMKRQPCDLPAGWCEYRGIKSVLDPYDHGSINVLVEHGIHTTLGGFVDSARELLNNRASLSSKQIRDHLDTLKNINSAPKIDSDDTEHLTPLIDDHNVNFLNEYAKMNNMKFEHTLILFYECGKKDLENVP